MGAVISSCGNTYEGVTIEVLGYQLQNEGRNQHRRHGARTSRHNKRDQRSSIQYVTVKHYHLPVYLPFCDFLCLFVGSVIFFSLKSTVEPV